MARKPRPNTAVVEVRFRVPKGVSAAVARKFVADLLATTEPHYTDFSVESEERFGSEPLHLRPGHARIERPA